MCIVFFLFSCFQVTLINSQDGDYYNRHDKKTPQKNEKRPFNFGAFSFNHSGTEDFEVYVSSDGTGDEASWTLVASGTLPDIRGMYCDEQPEPLVIKFDTVRGETKKYD